VGQTAVQAGAGQRAPRFLPTEIPEVLIVEPVVHRDERGFFLETYHEAKYRDGGIAARFVQDNHSRSVRGTLRGLHAQRTKPQGKLVRAIEGAIWDVAVDIRRGSPTFGRWVAAELTADNFRQLWIPAGFAHGFCVLSASAQVEYKCTALYDQADEITIAWDDPEIAIHWPLDDPLVSPKDRAGRRLAEILQDLPAYERS
jgi:dTDP-4-dehydrorhamnose 3,5-epimerase